MFLSFYTCHGRSVQLCGAIFIVLYIFIRKECDKIHNLYISFHPASASFRPSARGVKRQTVAVFVNEYAHWSPTSDFSFAHILFNRNLSFFLNRIPWSEHTILNLQVFHRFIHVQLYTLSYILCFLSCSGDSSVRVFTRVWLIKITFILIENINKLQNMYSSVSISGRSSFLPQSQCFSSAISRRTPRITHLAIQNTVPHRRPSTWLPRDVWIPLFYAFLYQGVIHVKLHDFQDFIFIRLLQDSLTQ